MVNKLHKYVVPVAVNYAVVSMLVVCKKIKIKNNNNNNNDKHCKIGGALFEVCT